MGTLFKQGNHKGLPLREKPLGIGEYFNFAFLILNFKFIFMFTGIIEDIGTIEKIEGNLFTVSHLYEEVFKMGESVALSGMCATIIKIIKDTFTVEIMKVSRDRTIFGEIKEGERINIERPVKMGSRNSGHFVLGHVDQVGKVLERKTVGDYVFFRISVLSKNQKLLVPKGSVSVDGISLTVSELGKNFLEVSIVSHTLLHTTLGEKKAGDKVNLEFDVLGKYVCQLTHSTGSGAMTIFDF